MAPKKDGAGGWGGKTSCVAVMILCHTLSFCFSASSSFDKKRISRLIKQFHVSLLLLLIFIIGESGICDTIFIFDLVFFKQFKKRVPGTSFAFLVYRDLKH